MLKLSRKIEIHLNNSLDVVSVCGKASISYNSYNNWPKKFEGLSRFPTIADPPNYGTKISQSLHYLQAAIPFNSINKHSLEAHSLSPLQVQIRLSGSCGV